MPAESMAETLEKQKRIPVFTSVITPVIIK
jgi:hypothetical protein